MSIFKSGSIRGKYGIEWDKQTAYRIGYYLAPILNAKTAVIGRDGRLSSEEISRSLSQGLMGAGCSVTNIGIIVGFFNVNSVDISVEV